MQRGRANSGLGLLPWLALAVLLHEFVVGLFVLVRLVAPPSTSASGQPMELTLVDEGELSSESKGMLSQDSTLDVTPPVTSLDSRSEEQKKAEERAKKEEQDTKARGQVVDIPQPVEEKVPAKSDYVAEYNSSVEKQTVHRGRPGEPEGAPPLPGQARSRGQPRPPQAAPPPPESPAQPGGAPSRLAMRAPGTEAGARGKQTGPEAAAEISPDGLLPRSPQAGGKPNAGNPGAAGTPASPGGKRPLTMADLTPSDETLARAIGRGGLVDALKDVEEGETTALNARRWKFASFFNRVKRAVADHWHPDQAYRRRNPQGNVYGFKDRLTVLRVELSPDGKLRDVFVEHPSGIDFLDDEAVRAFRDAQPFPNPPRQLVGESGMISFRFGFLFELSTSPSFRMFRYNN